MRIQMGDGGTLDVVLKDIPEKDIGTTLKEHYFDKIHFEEIDNIHQLPFVNLDKLYTRRGEVWQFRNFHITEDTTPAFFIISLDHIGYIIQE